MKYLITIVMIIISLVRLLNANEGLAQSAEFQFYVLTNSPSRAQVWRIDTISSQATEIFSLPVEMPNESFETFMPEYEIQAAYEYFQSLQLPEAQYEDFLEFEVSSYVRKIDVSDSGNKAILLVSHETCHRYFNDACFGVSQLILLTESEGTIVWEHAYHDPNPDFLADNCSTESTLAYKGEILSIDGWTSDEQGVVVSIGGDSCFISNDRPYVMVPFDNRPAFTLFRGFTPAHSPEGDQWASISRSCIASYDCQDSLVVTNITDLEIGSTNATTEILDGYISLVPDEIQWNAKYGIQFKVADQLQGSEFLATVDLRATGLDTIDYLLINNSFALVPGTTTTSVAWNNAGVLSHIEIQDDGLSLIPFYNEAITVISASSEGLFILQGQESSQYKIINDQGEIIEEIDLLNFFPNADDFISITLAG